jgi:hypothetical protein
MQFVIFGQAEDLKICTQLIAFACGERIPGSYEDYSGKLNSFILQNKFTQLN